MSDPDTTITGSILIEWPAPHAETSPRCDDPAGLHVDSWATVIRDAASGERLTGVNWVRLAMSLTSGPVTALVMSAKGDDGEPVRESQHPADAPLDGAVYVQRWYTVAGMSVAAGEAQ